MAKRLNFDSRGLRTGLEVGALLSELELRFIRNRRVLLNTALKDSGGFRNGLLSRLGLLNEANKIDAEKAIQEIAEQINGEYQLTKSIAVSDVDKRIVELKRKGFKPEIEPSGIIQVDSLMASSFTKTLLTIGTAVQAAMSTISTQSILIAGQVNESEPIPEQLDAIQAAMIKKGATVNTPQGNKELTAYGEFIMRNDSQRLYLGIKSERRSEYGLRYVQISAHPSSCPLCLPWQGKILIDDYFGGSAPDGKTPLYSTAINEGLHHFNCRHDSVEYIPGIDRADIFKKDTATVKETAERYAVEQTQRYNERGIRDWKKEAEAAITPERKTVAEAKVAEWQAKQRALRDISEKNGLPFYRQYDREQVGGDTMPQSTLSKLLRQKAS